MPSTRPTISAGQTRRAPLTLHNPALPLVVKEDFKRLAHGAAVGLLAAGIGALYTVYARWGIARGLESPDLTALRFGVAGLVTLPILVMAWRKDRQVLILRWKLWLLISLLAGTPFGLLTFGALQLAPASHSAVFPFAAMSIIGMLLGAIGLAPARPQPHRRGNRRPRRRHDRPDLGCDRSRSPLTLRRTRLDQQLGHPAPWNQPQRAPTCRTTLSLPWTG